VVRYSYWEHRIEYLAFFSGDPFDFSTFLKFSFGIQDNRRELRAGLSHPDALLEIDSNKLIDSKTCQIDNGVIFLCDVRDGHILVKQVSAELRERTPRYASMADFTGDEVERIAKENLAVREFIEKGGLGKSKSE
jgi:hypothetical protein